MYIKYGIITRTIECGNNEHNKIYQIKEKQVKIMSETGMFFAVCIVMLFIAFILCISLQQDD